MDAVTSRTSGPEAPSSPLADSARRLWRAMPRGWLLLSQVLLGVLLLGAWQWATEESLLNPMLFSSPERIAEELAEMAMGDEIYSRTIYDHILTTLKSILIGYVIGAPAAALSGFALGRSKLAAEVLEPYILVFFAIPKISLAPLFVIIFSTGLSSKVAIVVIEVFFIVFYSTLRGVLQVNEEFVHIAKVMGASRLTVLRNVLLPASLPSIVAGLRLAVPFAMIGAILGEYIASNQGLGWLVLYFGSTLDATGLFAALVFLVLVVALLDALVRVIEARAVPWQPPGGHQPTSDAVAVS
ncbi:MAG: ABC transporter permease [Micromonosporaceae bacterium]